MKYTRIVMLSLLLCPLILLAQSYSITVFHSGEDGYKSFRIPAIINLPNGNLLAFAEGRVNSGADFGHVNIVMKTSADKGKTWSALQVVASNGKLQAGNAAPVVDLSDPDYPKGRIFLFYNTGNNNEGQIRKRNGYREVWYVTSVDNGKTWSAPTNITNQVSKIDQPTINANWNHPEDWRSYANTPGHAMQLKTGKYKGRIYIAANHSEGAPQKDFTDYVAHGYYTDDHGKTFHISADNSFRGSNESTAAELPGGRVMMNSRNQQENVLQRIIAISNNGGAAWDTTYFDKQLPDPVCEGSILTLQYKKHGNILAFSNCASVKDRDSLTLRISYDDGQTWKKSFLAEAKDCGYSDIVKVDKQTVGILYEADGYRKIVFKKVNWMQ